MRADEYRARAEDCEQIARQQSGLGAKKLYENLASKWRELAMQAEWRERANQDDLVVKS
jgi:hypothetical protein